MREKGAIYCVLCYRHTPEEDFTVQFYQSNKYFNSPDAVTSIGESIINYHPFMSYGITEDSPEE